MAEKPIQLFSRVVIALNGGSCDDRIVRLVVEEARKAGAKGKPGRPPKGSVLRQSFEQMAASAPETAKAD